MPTKIPPTPTIQQPRLTPRAPAAATTAPNSVTSNSVARLSETFKKRRSAIWAVGVPVIVVAGVYIGAQYKSAQQAKDRAAAQKQKEGVAATGDTVPQTVVEATSVPITSQNRETTNNGAVNTVSDIGRGMSYNQRQISFLEDRRGVLMKQKFDLERKIERVKEKMKKEEEMEARREVDMRGVK